MFSGFSNGKTVARHGLFSPAGLWLCSDLANASKGIKFNHEPEETNISEIHNLQNAFIIVYINYTQDTMQKYALHHPIVF